MVGSVVAQRPVRRSAVNESSSALLSEPSESRSPVAALPASGDHACERLPVEALLEPRLQLVWSQAELCRVDGAGAWRDLPGHRLLAVVSGEALLETEAERRHLCSGEVALLPPGCAHRVAWRRAGRGASLYSFHLRLARGGRGVQLLQTPCYRSLPRVADRVAELHEALCAGGGRGRSRARALSYLLLSQLLDAEPDACGGGDADPGLNALQRQAVNAACRQHAAAPSVAELAERCGLSVDYFSRLFRRSFGMPPRQWLVESRVRRAAELLHHDGRPIAEVARSLGYRSEQLFGRQFKAVMGQSPAAYRRAHGQVWGRRAG